MELDFNEKCALMNAVVDRRNKIGKLLLKTNDHVLFEQYNTEYEALTNIINMVYNILKS